MKNKQVEEIYRDEKSPDAIAIELQEKRHKVNNEWCDYMEIVFEKYRDENTETRINVPEETGKILRRNGVQIDGIEQKDIYSGFDVIINESQHIEDYLKQQRGKYVVVMPY